MGPTVEETVENYPRLRTDLCYPSLRHKMRNRIVEEKITREREAFIQSIDRQTICDLASSYHDGARCRVFKTTHGSFNILFFVEFDSVSPQGKPDRWVIRIPFSGRVRWIDEKIDSEVATMKLVLLLYPSSRH